MCPGDYLFTSEKVQTVLLPVLLLTQRGLLKKISFRSLNRHSKSIKQIQQAKQKLILKYTRRINVISMTNILQNLLSYFIENLKKILDKNFRYIRYCMGVLVIVKPKTK